MAENASTPRSGPRESAISKVSDCGVDFTEKYSSHHLRVIGESGKGRNPLRTLGRLVVVSWQNPWIGTAADSPRTQMGIPHPLRTTPSDPLTVVFCGLRAESSCAIESGRRPLPP